MIGRIDSSGRNLELEAAAIVHRVTINGFDDWHKVSYASSGEVFPNVQMDSSESLEREPESLR
jgi:hypothetical protein